MLAALPSRVSDQPRRTSDDGAGYGAAWGDPAIVLRCGAPNGKGFAIFNIADSAICVGGALIVLLSLLGRDYDGTSTKSAKDTEKKEQA